MISKEFIKVATGFAHPFFKIESEKGFYNLDSVFECHNLYKENHRQIYKETKIFESFTSASESFYIDSDENQGNEMKLPEEWSTLTLFILGSYNSALEKMPITNSIIRYSISQMKNRIAGVTLSKLKPNSTIPIHTDYSALFFRYYLVLDSQGGNYFNLCGQKFPIKNGDEFAFDFCLAHGSENNSDHTRMSLLIDIWKPITNPVNYFLVTLSLKLSVFSRDKKNLEISDFVQYKDKKMDLAIDKVIGANIKLRHKLILIFNVILNFPFDIYEIRKKNKLQLSKLEFSNTEILKYGLQISILAYANKRNWNPISMLPKYRILNFIGIIKYTIEQNIPGGFCEAGVWRGGLIAVIKKYMEIYNIQRNIYAIDSYQGMETSGCQKERGESFEKDIVSSELLEKIEDHFSDTKLLNADLESVQKNIKSICSNLNNIVFVKGFFDEKFPWDQIDKLAILRIDCDYYTPTLFVLENLYDKLSVGGFVVLDEYYLDHFGQGKAVDEFRAKRNLKNPIIRIDHQSGFWIKE